MQLTSPLARKLRGISDLAISPDLMHGFPSILDFSRIYYVYCTLIFWGTCGQPCKCQFLNSQENFARELHQMNMFWAKPSGQCQSNISDPEQQIVPRHRCNMLDQILLVPCLCCDPEWCSIQADQDQRIAACWTRGAERCGGVVSGWGRSGPLDHLSHPNPSTFSRHLNDSSMVRRASEWGPWSPIWPFPVLHFNKKHGPHCKVR